MERIKAVKFITVMVLAVLTLAIACPSFSITSAAAENTVWHVDAVTAKQVGHKNLGSTYRSYNFANNPFAVGPDNKSNSWSISTYEIEESSQLTVSYNPYTMTLQLTAARSMYPNENQNQGYLQSGFQLCIEDNLGNQYPLDVNGGEFTIEDASEITTLTLYVQGSYRAMHTFTPSTVYFQYVRMLATLGAFDITVSSSAPARTITDSEGTVWTVPEGVENPVVIRTGYGAPNRYLLDGVSGLCYFKNPLDQSVNVLGSNEQLAVFLYQHDGSKNGENLIQENAENYGINPVYCAFAHHFTSFLYGSLPEMEVTPLNPAPTESPSPTVPPDDSEQLRDLGTVRIGKDENGSMVNETTVYVPGGVLTYETKNVDFVSNAEPTGFDYIRHAVIEDYCPKFIGVFNLNTDIDGYCSLQFPDLYLFPERIKPEEYVPLDANKVVFPTGTGLPEIGLLSEWAEPIVILYANGQKYEVSPYGGNVRIPVNKGNNRVLMEIGLQVKDEFLSNHEGYIQSVYQMYLEDFAVYIRDYQDQTSSAILQEIQKANDELIKQTQEQQKQTEALTKYENADKMDSDNDKLTGAIGDYNEVSDSLFESAGGSMSDFDLGSAFEYSSSLIAAFGFLATVITSIIQQMGWYSMLYPIGIALVIIGALLGLSRYMSSAGPGEMPKDQGMSKDQRHYYADPTQKRLPDNRKRLPDKREYLPDHRKK